MKRKSDKDIDKIWRLQAFVLDSRVRSWQVNLGVADSTTTLVNFSLFNPKLDKTYNIQNFLSSHRDPTEIV